jgi:hypothetical protein
VSYPHDIYKPVIESKNEISLIDGSYFAFLFPNKPLISKTGVPKE